MTMTTTVELRAAASDALAAIMGESACKASLDEPGGHGLAASTPITGETLFTIAETTSVQAEHTIAAAEIGRAHV